MLALWDENQEIISKTTKDGTNLEKDENWDSSFTFPFLTVSDKAGYGTAYGQLLERFQYLHMQ